MKPVRLTEKIGDEYAIAKKYVGVGGGRLFSKAYTVQEVIDKLGQYEDFEERFGMTLVELFGILCSDGIYVKNSQGIRGYGRNVSGALAFGYDDVKRDWYFTYRVRGFPQYYLKDKGITWSTKREDLE